VASNSWNQSGAGGRPSSSRLRSRWRSRTW